MTQSTARRRGLAQNIRTELAKAKARRAAGWTPTHYGTPRKEQTP